VGVWGGETVKITQNLVTQTFQCRNGTSGLYHDLDDVKRIQEVLQNNLGVFLSESEVIDFWHHRSSAWDGSWLSIMGGEKEILEWFQKFIEFIGVEIDEEEEEKPTSSFRITDPNIIRELDSLTPEQVEKLNGFLEDGLKELREKQK
jgi:hypothetical protein